MQDKISNEERARIYGAYLGSPIRHNPYCEHPKLFIVGILKGVGQQGVLIQHFTKQGAPWNELTGSEYKNCQLILTPLSDIADEHLQELAETVLGLGKMTKDAQIFCALSEIFYNVNKRLVKERQDYRTADYLRFKSYALPFNGIDLFQANIATKKGGAEWIS